MKQLRSKNITKNENPKEKYASHTLKLKCLNNNAKSRVNSLTRRLNKITRYETIGLDKVNIPGSPTTKEPNHSKILNQNDDRTKLRSSGNGKLSSSQKFRRTELHFYSSRKENMKTYTPRSGTNAYYTSRGLSSSRNRHQSGA